MKVFQLNDYEWWAGEDLESVKAAYLKETGVSEEEAFEDPQEVSEADMQVLKYYQTEGVFCSFAEALADMLAAGDKFPCCFACTEY
jgi:hypothetical protein